MKITIITMLMEMIPAMGNVGAPKKKGCGIPNHAASPTPEKSVIDIAAAAMVPRTRAVRTAACLMNPRP